MVSQAKYTLRESLAAVESALRIDLLGPDIVDNLLSQSNSLTPLLRSLSQLSSYVQPTLKDKDINDLAGRVARVRIPAIDFLTADEQKMSTEELETMLLCENDDEYDASGRDWEEIEAQVKMSMKSARDQQMSATVQQELLDLEYVSSYAACVSMESNTL